MFESLFETYPEYKTEVQFIVFDDNGIVYDPDTIRQLLDNSKNNTVIFAYEFPFVDSADKLSDILGDNEPTALADIGFDVDKYKKSSYKYIFDGSTFNNKLYFATWQACPGAVVYNRNIAKKVLGTDDPEKVQEAIKDWDAFYNTAVAVDKAGYSILSGPDELGIVHDSVYDAYGYLYHEQTLEELKDEYKDGMGRELTKEELADIEYAKKIAPYTKGHESWSDEWNVDMSSDDVFLWFGTTWFDAFILFGESSGDNFGICPGPEGYYWGGTVLGVYDNGACESVAAELLELLCCDYDVQQSMLDDFEYVNNTNVIEDNIRKGSNGSFDDYGIGDSLRAWHIDLLDITGQEFDESVKINTVPM